MVSQKKREILAKKGNRMNTSGKIAVLGSGNIDGNVGAKWLAARHHVVFGG